MLDIPPIRNVGWKSTIQEWINADTLQRCHVREIDAEHINLPGLRTWQVEKLLDN